MDPKQIKLFRELGDIYKILGIEATKDEKVIKKAYKNKAKELHPDKNPAPNAKEMYIHLKQAYDILMNPEQKELYDKYKDNQKYHEERVAGQNKIRRQFGEELLKKEKANQETNQSEKEYKMTKEEQKREEGKRMKREWEEEEQRLNEKLEKKVKMEKTEGKEYTMIELKWSKNNDIYNNDIIKILFGKYGDINNVVVFPSEHKALIEYKSRPSAEKAYQENKAKEEENGGVDDGLKVSLVVKENIPEQSTGPKISGLFNRDSKVMAGLREEELRRQQERQRIIEETLAQEGVV